MPHLLCYGQHSAGYICERVSDSETSSRAQLAVERQLRKVFDKRTRQLEVAQQVEQAQAAQAWKLQPKRCRIAAHCKSGACKRCPHPMGHALVAAVVGANLDQRQRRCRRGVHRKHDVVAADVNGHSAVGASEHPGKVRPERPAWEPVRGRSGTRTRTQRAQTRSRT